MFYRIVAALGLALVAPVSLANDWPIYLTVDGMRTESNSQISTDNQVSTTFPPEEISLDGLPFDDESFGWSAGVGYQLLDGFALELGYMDLGTLAAGGVQINAEKPELSTNAIYLASQFRYPLADKLHATWHLGITRASFEADGSVILFGLPPIFTPVINSIEFGDPDDETGYFFGFGVSYTLSHHFDIGLRFSRHDFRVLEHNTFGLRLTARL